MNYNNVAERIAKAIVKEIYPSNEEIIDSLYDMFELREYWFVEDDGIYYWDDGDYCGHYFEKHLITKDKDKVEILKAIELLKRKYKESEDEE
jgi:hypothetical protein